MDKTCICHLRDIYRAISALEQEMQKLHGVLQHVKDYLRC